MSVQPFPTRSAVVQLPSRNTRSLIAIRADLAGLLREVDSLIAAQGSGAQSPAGPTTRDQDVLTLGRAADAIGWCEQRLRAAIVRQIKAKVPVEDRFAWQPGGVKNTPWRVDMARLHRYVRNLPPDAL